MSSSTLITLTPAEAKALAEYQTSLLGLYAAEPELRTHAYQTLKADHPDETALRFLHVASLNVDKAVHLYKKALTWRKTVGLDADIMRNGEPGAVRALADMRMSGGGTAEREDNEAFLAQFRVGKSYTHGVDVAGRPVTIVRVQLHRGADQPAAIMERFILWQIESVHLAHACGHFTTPKHDSIMLFDLSNFGLANMDYTPVKFIIETFNRYYPGSLGGVIIHNTPWIFKQFWYIIKGWIPEGFRDKVHFTSNVEELSKLIPADQIEKALGGEDPWEYKYIEQQPAPADEHATGAGNTPQLLGEKKAEREKLEAERLQIADRIDAATKEWAEAVKAGKGDAEVTQIREKREADVELLKKNYWQLDPLVRARGLLDEWGMIKNPVLG